MSFDITGALTGFGAAGSAYTQAANLREQTDQAALAQQRQAAFEAAKQIFAQDMATKKLQQDADQFATGQQTTRDVAAGVQAGENLRTGAGIIAGYPQRLDGLRDHDQMYGQLYGDATTEAVGRLGYRNVTLPAPGVNITTLGPKTTDAEGNVTGEPNVTTQLPALPPSATMQQILAQKTQAAKATLTKLLTSGPDTQQAIAGASVTGISKGRAALSTTVQAAHAIAYNKSLHQTAADAGVPLDPAQLLPVPGTPKQNPDGSTGYTPQFALPPADQVKAQDLYRQQKRDATDAALRRAGIDATRRGQDKTAATQAASQAATTDRADKTDIRVKAAQMYQAKHAAYFGPGGINEAAKARDDANNDANSLDGLLQRGTNPTTMQPLTGAERAQYQGMRDQKVQQAAWYQRQVDQKKTALRENRGDFSSTPSNTSVRTITGANGRVLKVE